MMLKIADEYFLHTISSYLSNKGVIPIFRWWSPLFSSVVVGGCPPWLGVEVVRVMGDRWVNDADGEQWHQTAGGPLFAS